MIHHAAPDFWTKYRALPVDVQNIADRAFVLLKADPHHPSLHFSPNFTVRASHFAGHVFAESSLYGGSSTLGSPPMHKKQIKDGKIMTITRPHRAGGIRE